MKRFLAMVLASAIFSVAVSNAQSTAPPDRDELTEDVFLVTSILQKDGKLIDKVQPAVVVYVKNHGFLQEGMIFTPGGLTPAIDNGFTPAIMHTPLPSHDLIVPAAITVPLHDPGYIVPEPILRAVPFINTEPLRINRQPNDYWEVSKVLVKGREVKLQGHHRIIQKHKVYLE